MDEQGTAASNALSEERRDSAVSQADSIGEDEGAHMADLSDSASDAGSGGGKDSGCEVAPDAKEPPYTPPTPEQAERIVSQVEFYFSDANITKDAFLLKHVKRNKEGYVSLKLISSFKRVKHLTKDWRAVAEALKASTQLEINEAGTKLRRLAPLPAYDETTPSRTVVATDLPLEKPSVENVSRLFAACGEIALVRVLRPGNPVPADVRHFLNKNPGLVGSVCALVEYTESEAARSALRLQDAGMRVFELNNVPKEAKKKPTSSRRQLRLSCDCECSSCYSGSEAEEARTRFRRGSAASGYFIPRSPDAGWLPRRLSNCSHSGSDSGYSAYCYSPRRLSSASQSGSESYLSRRLSSCSLGGDCTRRAPRWTEIPRTPHGPDGTRGFHATRQRRISDLALYSR